MADMSVVIIWGAGPCLLHGSASFVRWRVAAKPVRNGSEGSLGARLQLDPSQPPNALIATTFAHRIGVTADVVALRSIAVNGL